jgi:gliding motility-associated-like protein
VCAGFDVKLSSQNGPGFVYTWTPATGLDDPSSPAPDARPEATLTYTLHINDSTCAAYDSSFAVEVVVRPSPVITAEKNNDIDCAVHTAQLRADGGVSYQWLPVSGLNNPYSPSPVASIDTTTTYVVRGMGSNGCYAYDTLTVNVTATGANTFVVPNAFTPNGDGHNDCFGVARWGDIQLEELSVYNRWGMRVFSTRNPSECWDGTYRGKQQEMGTYVYIIRARTYCGEITRTGTLILVR